MSGWENKKERNEPEEKKKTFWAEDESRVCNESNTLIDPEQGSGCLSAGWDQYKCSGAKERDLNLSQHQHQP